MAARSLFWKYNIISSFQPCERDNLAKNDRICFKFGLNILKGNISDKFEFEYDPTKNMAARSLFWKYNIVRSFRSCERNNLAINGRICFKFGLNILKGNISDKFEFGLIWQKTWPPGHYFENTISLAHSNLVNAITWPKMIGFVSNFDWTS